MDKRVRRTEWNEPEEYRTAGGGAGEWLSELWEAMTVSLFGRLLFPVLAALGFWSVFNLFGDMLTPVYLEWPGLYLDGENFRWTGWVIFGMNLGMLMLAGYGKRSVVNLIHMWTVPFLLCLALQGFGVNLRISAAAAAAALCLGAAGTALIWKVLRPRWKRTAGKRRARRRIYIKGARSGRRVWTAAVLVLGLCTLLLPGRRMYAVRLLENDRNDERLWETQKEALCDLKEERYAQLAVEERVRLLQTVADLEMAGFGVDRVSVRLETQEDSGNNGYYDTTENEIVLNPARLSDGAGAEEALDTLLHECFHAYESACVEAVDWESVDVSLEPYCRAADWRNDFLSYKNADGEADFKEYLNYYNQAVEEDAREYSAWRTPLYLEYADSLP